MALREFRDEAGRAWRAWDIPAEKLHPSTRAENHMQGVLEGWLVFETIDGSAKARLYPIPPSWRTASPEELRQMLAVAERTRESGEYERFASKGRAALQFAGRGVAATTPAPRADRTSNEVRSFRYPGGRYWSVAEYVIRRSVNGSGASEQPVLRFTAGARSLDATSWPPTWRSFSDHQLADLLWQSFPRAPADAGADGGYRRRRGDLDAGA
jgi:hypothetical protein